MTRVFTKELYDIISKAHKGIPLSEEHKRKISEEQKGKVRSAEHCTKLSEALKGRVFTEEHKRKLSESHMGHIPGNKGIPGKANSGSFQKGHSLGVPCSEEVRKMVSLKNRGSGNGMWKGGITSPNQLVRQSRQYRAWREMVFLRDNWTCQVCMIRGHILHPHHFHSFARYPEQRFDVSNGITMCKRCHYKFHKKFGYLCTTENLNSYLGEYSG
jgi:hypothetical protein